jgi:hypothetical protein
MRARLSNDATLPIDRRRNASQAGAMATKG